MDAIRNDVSSGRSIDTTPRNDSSTTERTDEYSRYERKLAAREHKWREETAEHERLVSNLQRRVKQQEDDLLRTRQERDRARTELSVVQQERDELKVNN